MSTNKYGMVMDERLAASLDRAIGGLALAVREGRRSCVTCCFFDPQAETCTKAAPAARPPAEIIAFGCPAYELMPF
jgi:hypothetical protein